MTIYWGDGTSTATHPSGGAAQTSGTWSPTYSNFSPGSDGSLTTNAAQYIAVGDLVHFNIRFSIGWYTYDSDNMGFTLPYTNGGNRNVVVGWVQSNNIYLIGKIDSGSSYCMLAKHSDNNGIRYRDYWNNTLQLSGTYQK